MGGLELCSACSQLNLDVELPLGLQELGSYEQLLRKSRSLGPGRSGCGGCRFFYMVLQTSDKWRLRLAELQGRTVFLRQAWRGDPELRLDAKMPLADEVATFDFDDQILEACTEDPFPGSDSKVDYRHYIPVDPLDENCFNLILSWMKECVSHVGCASVGPVPLPKRVIEVPTDPAQPCRLRITGSSSGHYVILSHCWGSSDITMKLKDSVTAEFQNTIPYEDLPRSFQDAIQITRRLGFIYLWIDALCISQDNAEDWAEEAPKMSLYYGRSTLMISATAAEDSTRGILTKRHIRYSPLLGKGRTYQLRPGQLSSSYGIDSSVLATRGWAAQERVLAPRIVHYTTHQMVWECGHGHEFEASRTKYVKHIWDLDKAAVQPLVTDALQAIDTTKLLRRSRNVAQNAEKADSNLSKRLDAWHSSVQEYSRRNLTLPSDKLHAISGIASILNYDGAMGEYLSGVWSKHLGAGLAWSNANWSPFDTLPIYTAPSWSWASLEGPVEPDTLGRATEFILPHRNKWLAKFDLKLLKSEMILQSPRNPYGAVMEGSHIVVEGACITKSGFSQLHQTDIFTRANLAFDNGNKDPCSCSLPFVKETKAIPIADKDANVISSKEESACGDSHCDFYLFLLGDNWYSRSQAVIDLLLMSWVSREAAVAKRVGYAKILLDLKDEELETVSAKICATDWKRMELKLV